jgi:hypothetical protein
MCTTATLYFQEHPMTRRDKLHWCLLIAAPIVVGVGLVVWVAA